MFFKKLLLFVCLYCLCIVLVQAQDTSFVGYTKNWQMSPVGSDAKQLAWNGMKTKARTFDELQYVWTLTPDTLEKRKTFEKMLGVQSTTFKQWYKIYAFTSIGGQKSPTQAEKSRFEELYNIQKQGALDKLRAIGTFADWEACSNTKIPFAFAVFTAREMSLKAVSFDQYQKTAFFLKKISLEAPKSDAVHLEVDKYVVNVLEKMRSLAKTFAEWYSVYYNTPSYDSGARKQALKNMKALAQTVLEKEEISSLEKSD